MVIYSLDAAVRIAAVWAQDPTLASAGQPGLDVASLVPPMREGDAGKKSTIYLDKDGDGFVSAGDTLEYDIRAASNARSAIPGPFRVRDALPGDVTYVPGTVRYRYTLGGVWQTWTNVPDDVSGSPFPLDGVGFSVPGILQMGQQMQVTFRAVIDNYADLAGSTIVNTGDVEISPYGLLVPLEWEDTLYGSIGDRIWTDTNGDGTQNAGEPGIPNIRVYGDTNGNGSYDAGEPIAITDSSGNYLLSGLLAGTYTVRVDSAAISSINPGFGPTFDLDGIATSHVATVVLAAAQQRKDADFGYRGGSSVGDRVWMDRDGDGVQEPGEPGINGVRVYSDSNNNGTYEAGEPNTFTSADGAYLIGNLNPGTFQIRIDTTTLPAGAAQTFDANGALDHRASVTFVGSEHNATVDFGYRGTLSVGDLVWEDLDANGSRILYDVFRGRIDLDGDGGDDSGDDGTIGTIRIIDGEIDIDGDGDTDNDDDGVFQGFPVINSRLNTNGDSSANNDDNASRAIASEVGLANVRVFIDSNVNGAFDPNEPSSVTNANGIYSIGNLFSGTYAVRVDSSTLPGSYVSTYDLTTPLGDHSATVTLSAASRTDVDFGYRNDATLGDLVWNDRNGNGVRDAGEPGISGVLVYIDDDDDGFYDYPGERSAITGINGSYIIGNLPARTFRVRVEISTLPAGVTPTYDLDGGSDNRADRTLALSQNATDVDFGYRTTASVGDFVWRDSNGNGVPDSGEPGMNGIRVYLDSNGNGTFESATEPSAVTDSSGAYVIANLVPATYTARVDTSTLVATDVQTYDLTGGLDNAATFSLSAGQVRTDLDFGYTTRVSIGDLVWNDANANGQKDASETGLQGVGVSVVNASNNTIQGTTTTNSNGAYSFNNLLPGTYYVIFDPLAGYNRTVADQGADASDSDANALTGQTPDITLAAGQSNTTIDAGYCQPGSISGTVLADTDNNDTGDVGILGVTLTLKDAAGNDIDSNPSLAGIQPTTTTTAANGTYSFTNLPPGSYRVGQTQPFGYESVSDRDGGDINIIGDNTPVVVTAGQTNAANNFIEKVDTCPDNWAEWKYQHPGEVASGNPDLDSHDNLTEFAFAMPAGSGAGDAWRIRPSVITAGKIDGVFTRPTGAVDNVVYTLQYSSSIANPVSWTSIVITPSVYTVVNNGNCTETITIEDLETLTGLTGGKGVVRIQADLDEENDSVIDHTSYTQVEGWKVTEFGVCCQTYATPYLRDTVFTGTVDAGGVGGQVLSFSGSAGTVDLATLLAPGAGYFLEVTDGDNEGQRFDIVSATGPTITVANDPSLNSNPAPFNTVTGPPSANLAGDSVVVRRHWTVDEMFPPSGFVATGDQATADQLQIFSGGVWTILHLYDDGGNPRWVDNFNALVSQGGTVLPPGQGLFFNNRNGAKSLLTYGEVRENDFRRPLGTGYNFVSGGYPLNQSATGNGSRTMSLAGGFFGSRDFKTADSFFLWKGDATPGLGTYDTYYMLMNGAAPTPSLLRWVRVGDSLASPRDAEILLLENRAVFTRSAAGLASYGYPRPWNP